MNGLMSSGIKSKASFLSIAQADRCPKSNRTMFNAILWITRSGAAWRDLPKECYGSWETVYSRFYLWRDTGLLESFFSALIRKFEY